MKLDYISKNGKIMPRAEAVVSVESVEYSYGFCVYETIRVSQGVIYFMTDHIKRLFESASYLKLEHSFDTSKIYDWIFEIVKLNEQDTFNLKLLLIGGKNQADATLFIMPTVPFFIDKKLYKSGANTVTVQYERFLPKAKSLNMLGSFLAYREAKNQDCYDALLIDKDGNVREGTRTNFFTIRGKNIYTAPEDKILSGIIREKVLEVAKKYGFKIIYQDISLDSLALYDGAFLTSTSSKIMPLKNIDKLVYKEIPAEVKNLMKYFEEFIGHYKSQYAQPKK